MIRDDETVVCIYTLFCFNNRIKKAPPLFSSFFSSSSSQTVRDAVLARSLALVNFVLGDTLVRVHAPDGFTEKVTDAEHG